jgi:chromosomal replication initiation ATPase DnaA
VSDIKGKSQAGDIMKARLIFCQLARNKTGQPLEKIGRFIGRTHGSVISACRSIQRQRARMTDEKNIWDHYLEIEKSL